MAQTVMFKPSRKQLATSRVPRGGGLIKRSFAWDDYWLEKQNKNNTSTPWEKLPVVKIKTGGAKGNIEPLLPAEASNCFFAPPGGRPPRSTGPPVLPPGISPMAEQAMVEPNGLLLN